MDWLNQLGGVLQRYTGASANSGADDVHSDFDQVAQSAPNSAIADGLTAAFRSDQTPPFEQMVANLFSRSGGQQQAGLLNTLIAAAGPTLVSQILARKGGSGMDISRLLSNGQTQLQPEQVQQIPPDAVQEIAAHAEKNNPSIVDQISGFYAEHPTLIKTLGGAALAVAMAKIAERQYGS